MPSHLEREAKFAVLDDFVLPDLAPFTVDEPVLKRLDATYVDTEDFRLARWHITLRYRTDSSGDEPAGWTLKLPQAQSKFLTREEHYFPGDAGTVPPEVARLVAGLVGDHGLGPIAHMVTDRSERVVRDGTERLASLTDDRVTAGERSFRELEVELLAEVQPESLQPLLERLVAAGARPEASRSKLHMVLGPKASLPPMPAMARLGKRATAEELIRRVTAKSTRRLMEQALALRLSGGAIETVHQTRVATRRLRSDLRTFRNLLDPEWVQSLRDELRWLADPLGEVRDLDVMIGRLGDVAHALAPDDQLHAEALLEKLRQQRGEAFERLTAELDDRRFPALISRLIDASERPPVTDDAKGKAVTVVVPLVVRPWKQLRTAVKELEDPPTDEALHEVRIKAKRARYALEAAEPVLGKAARRHAEAIADLQGVLGDLHDTVVARERLRAIATSYTDPRAALVVGTLVGWEQAQHDLLRNQWPDAWDKASAKKLRRWAV